MKIKWPTLWRKKSNEQKAKTYDPEIDLAINTAGAVTLVSTFILFPEPVITTAVGFVLAVSTGTYHYYKVKQSRQKAHEQQVQEIGNDVIYLELIKIKIGVYAILGVIFVWGASVVSLKLFGLFFKTIEFLPIYIRVLWALAFGGLAFVWLASFKSNSSDAFDKVLLPIKGDVRKME